MISSDTLAFLKTEIKECIEYAKYRTQEDQDVWSQIKRINDNLLRLVQEIEESQLEQE